MQKIQKIVKQIDCEIKASEDYAENALKYKTEDKDLSELYIFLANAELEHVDKLHSIVMRIIDKYRMEHGEPPKEMKAIWDWEHQRHIEHITEIKILLDMARK